VLQREYSAAYLGGQQHGVWVIDFVFGKHRLCHNGAENRDYNHHSSGRAINQAGFRIPGIPHTPTLHYCNEAAIMAFCLIIPDYFTVDRAVLA
jgi:hypothetical protein